MFNPDRRQLLLTGLALGGFTTASIGATGPVYRRLQTPVIVPTDKLVEPWQTIAFDARVADVDNHARVLLKGLLLRLPAQATGTPRFAAFCVLCPHEICHVDLQHQTDHVTTQLPRKPPHPLFVCPCHFSVFDPLAEGAVLAGPAGRGLFRFELAVGEDQVTVVAVEEGAILW